ncbi:LptA/OstA family protein [Caulobacter sp. UNC279MFTsu5.1]|uniref:LptA/OstA family protein n=1 Tax=Caulobacter sp. UNC279MFTsu5.1 TaxID=1502775 RepID=UPI0008E5FDAD|nr:LptA/OstA family protein [Caulobacter sp. UNC279MFTsu5.1]SFJ48125.1 lipopolysaccharide export system protein LptA [Caulobacter sp. UNC279MFTsu5.1]
MNRWMAPTAIALSLLSGPALLAGFGGAAMAQTTAGGGNNSSAPVDISADEQEVINSQCKTIFRGAVEVLQDKARMRAATMTVYNRRKTPGKNSSPTGNNDCGDVDRVEADGNVFYVTPEQTVRGDHAVYDYATDTIVVTGDVVAVQGQDVARGDRMTIKTKTNDVKMESNATGRGKTRVRAVLYPDQNKDKKPAGKP